MVIKHFYYFGPVSSNLCKRIRDENWRAVLRGTAQAADVEVTERPEARMRSWIEGEGLGEHTVDFVGKKEQLGSPMPSHDGVGFCSPVLAIESEEVHVIMEVYGTTRLRARRPHVPRPREKSSFGAAYRR